MRVLCLITYTDCENKYRSLQSIGHEVFTQQYDNRPHEQHHELVDTARSWRPDFILFIGAIEQYHGRPVPQPDVLRALNSVAPMVHMCDDAGDPPWWPMLEVYEKEKCFTVQVSIDGAPGTPIDRFENGMLELTPIDWRSFKPVPWEQKTIKLGMVGGLGHSERKATTEALQQKGLIDFRQGPIGRTYDEMGAIMCNTKITYNYGITGSTQSMHVKGRVVETGFAGSVLLEKRGSPTKNWFEPGVDYLEFDNAEEAAQIVEITDDDHLRQMAARFHCKVFTRHHPLLFWQRVLTKALGRS
jgi:hypothetical protein